METIRLHRHSSPTTAFHRPLGSPPPPSLHTPLPPAPLHLTSLEVTATELVWRGGTLHQQDQALDLRGQCEARLGEWVAMDYPTDGDELGEVADPGADDTILCEESAIISNQQLVNLSVRELNKRLHGVSREEV